MFIILKIEIYCMYCFSMLQKWQSCRLRRCVFAPFLLYWAIQENNDLLSFKLVPQYLQFVNTRYK